MSEKPQAIGNEAPGAGEQLELGFEADAAALAGSDRVHRWYEYVQGFDPELAARKLKERAQGEQVVALDPFCGSGTTLVAAQFLGFEAVGSDANPLMCLVSEAKTTWNVPPEELREHAERVLRAIRRAGGKPSADEGPEIPMKSFNKWFRPEVLKEVAAGSRALRELEGQDLAVVRLLRMAYAKALFDSSQVSMCPGITFVKRPRPPLSETFARRSGMIVSDLRMLRSRGLHERGPARVFTGDARRLGGQVGGESVDLIFTSPPYPTDVEYTRQTRAELFFLGFVRTMDDVRAIKKRMVRGSPKNLYESDNNERLVARYDAIGHVSGRIADRLRGKNWGWDYARMVREYFGDMLLCLREMLRVLKPGGWAMLVVGDQTCKGVMIPVTAILRRIGLDLGFADSYVEQVRERRSTTHSMALPENVLALRKAGEGDGG